MGFEQLRASSAKMRSPFCGSEFSAVQETEGGPSKEMRETARQFHSGPNGPLGLGEERA